MGGSCESIHVRGGRGGHERRNLGVDVVVGDEMKKIDLIAQLFLSTVFLRGPAPLTFLV